VDGGFGGGTGFLGVTCLFVLVACCGLWELRGRSGLSVSNDGERIF